MRKLLRSLNDRLTVRSWIALCLMAAATVGIPYLMGSRFVAQRRAALALQRAHAHLTSREFQQARSELLVALRLQPGDAAARRQLAATELALGNVELAFLEFQSLTEMHPEDPDGWIGLANLMEKSGLLEAPEAALDKAIDAAPQRADARLLRGDIRFRLGRYYGALQDALVAVASAPSDATSWALLVRSAARAQGADAGIDTAGRAVAVVGEHPALLSVLASLLAQRGRVADARAMLQREIAGSASGSERARSARQALARIELGVDNAAEAQKLLDALISEGPADEEVLALRAVVEARGGQLESSLAHLEAAIASHPGSRLLRETRDRLQLARNNSVAFAELLTEMAARGLGPRPAPPRSLRADAQTGRGNLGEWTREHWPGRLAEIRQSLESALQRRDWAGAERIVDSARQEYPSSAFAPFLGGILELARGNLDEAERQLSEALAIAPRLPAILAALGRTWSRKRGAAFAGQQLMDLAARDPELPIARYMAARAYIEAGDPPRAEASLRRGLQLQPDSPAPYKHLTDYYFGLDRAAEALDICREGLNRFPQDTDLQMMLAQVEAGTGQSRDAIRVYEELTSRRPDLDLAQYKLAMVLAAQTGDEPRQRFIAALERLRGDTPSDPLLLDALGWMHYGAHDARRARELLEAAAKGAPDEPSLHYHLAMVYAQERELTLVRQELRSALESPRPFAERIEALRLLRQDELAPTPKGTASTTSRRH